MLGDIYSKANQDKTHTGIIMGQKSLNNVASMNSNSSYRYFKINNALNALEKSIELVDKNIMISHAEEYDNFKKLLSFLHYYKPPIETIAYRIKKTSGRFLDNTARVTDTQENYFMNCNSLKNSGDKMTYYDTQVKYGEDYTYTLYAYVVVPGYQYKYSDLRIGRNIGTISNDLTMAGPLAGEFIETIGFENHCIEFYNPYSGGTLPQLLNTKTNLLGNDYIAHTSDPDVISAFGVAIATGLKMGDIDPMIYGGTFNKSLAEFTYYMEEFPMAYSLMAPFDEETFVSEYLTAYSILHGGNAEKQLALYNKLMEQWCLYNKVHNYFGSITTLASPAPNRYATNSQIKSSNKYLADFNFHLMPTVKVVELPIGSKTFRISDNPPVAADVTPYQRKDDSQTVGFYVNVESFRFPRNATDTTSKSVVGRYPTPLNSGESTTRRIYMDSNDMLEKELVQNNSVSKPAALEVYRLDRKPNSISDFSQYLVYTKNLSYKQDSTHKLTNCFYEERIQTNKKYYYLFRLLNEHNQPGYLSPVQVVEMVDDGGYKYTKFDVIYETDFDNSEPMQESVPLKKVLEIVPHPRQLEIDDSQTDYSQPAGSQLRDLIDKVGSAEELIWGKTYKFRITSKKTGKKIDINVKYNLRNT